MRWRSTPSWIWLSVSRRFFFRWPWVLESGRDYDVSLDGERFLMAREGDLEPGDGELVVVQNWFEELERLAPKR